MPARKYDERYRQFLIAVYKRDGSKCQYPGCIRRYGLQVHHITRWADNPLRRYHPQNGIVLCRKCHKRVTGNETMFAPILRQIVIRNSLK